MSWTAPTQIVAAGVTNRPADISYDEPLSPGGPGLAGSHLPAGCTFNS
jgi:hypothetical protein